MVEREKNKRDYGKLAGRVAGVLAAGALLVAGWFGLRGPRSITSNTIEPEKPPTPEEVRPMEEIPIPPLERRPEALEPALPIEPEETAPAPAALKPAQDIDYGDEFIIKLNDIADLAALKLPVSSSKNMLFWDGQLLTDAWPRTVDLEIRGRRINIVDEGRMTVTGVTLEDLKNGPLGRGGSTISIAGGDFDYLRFETDAETGIVTALNHGQVVATLDEEGKSRLNSLMGMESSMNDLVAMGDIVLSVERWESLRDGEVVVRGSSKLTQTENSRPISAADKVALMERINVPSNTEQVSFLVVFKGEAPYIKYIELNGEARSSSVYLAQDSEEAKEAVKELFKIVGKPELYDKAWTVRITVDEENNLSFHFQNSKARLVDSQVYIQETFDKANIAGLLELAGLEMPNTIPISPLAILVHATLERQSPDELLDYFARISPGKVDVLANHCHVCGIDVLVQKKAFVDEKTTPSRQVGEILEFDHLSLNENEKEAPEIKPDRSNHR